MEKGVSIASQEKFLCVEVALPQEQAGDFIIKFGLKFGHVNMSRSRFTEKKIDDYFFDCDCWHVVVAVTEKQVPELSEFIKSFCTEKNLPFSGELSF